MRRGSNPKPKKCKTSCPLCQPTKEQYAFNKGGSPSSFLHTSPSQASIKLLTSNNPWINHLLQLTANIAYSPATSRLPSGYMHKVSILKQRFKRVNCGRTLRAMNLSERTLAISSSYDALMRSPNTLHTIRAAREQLSTGITPGELLALLQTGIRILCKGGTGLSTSSRATSTSTSQSVASSPAAYVPEVCSLRSAHFGSVIETTR